MPSTNKSYRVEVIDKRYGDWSGERRCSLGISLGAHYHERGKFRATVDWVSDRFESCAIILCDTLQRFNSPAFYRGDEAAALRDAIAFGDDWLRRNSDSLAAFSIPHVVSRWEDWRNHPDFKRTLALLEKIWAKDSKLQEIVTTDVARFIKNNPLSDGQKEISPQLRINSGISYMLEEMAGLALFAKEHGSFEVYAGPKITAIDYLIKERPGEIPLELLTWRSLKIDFRAL